MSYWKKIKVWDGEDTASIDASGNLQVKETNFENVFGIDSLTSPTPAIKVEEQGVVSIDDGGSSITVDATNLDIRNLTSLQDSIQVSQSTASNLNAQVVGDASHDAVDSGKPIKIGGKAIDSDPSQAEGDNAPTEVAENDRVNTWIDRSGRVMTGVESRYELLTEIDQTYNDTVTTDTSNAYECWMYRECTLMFSLQSSGTPTRFKFEIEVSPDGTNWYKLMNDFLGILEYEDTATSTQIHKALSFTICAYKIRVKVTATGTTASDTFTLDNTALFMRN